MAALRVLLGLLMVSKLCESQCDNSAKEYSALKKGEIKSPSTKEGKYPNNLNCEYRIKAPQGYRIKLTFKDLDIAPSTSCTSDKLLVRGKAESIIGIFCGSQIPRPVITPEDENEVVLVFQTGFPKTGRGFKIKYEAAQHFELCAKDEGVCKNRNCYNVKKICDGVDDCGDGTDEEDCGLPVKVPSDECGNTPIKPNTIHGSPDRMVGGDVAAPNSWPWQASIQLRYVEPNGHFCGGVLVSAQWVLTAARCFLDAQHPNSIRVTLGSHKMFSISKFEQVRIAEKIIAYPDLEGDKLREASLEDDIALIKLNAPVLYNDGVQPVCLPYNHWDAKPGWTCYTTGWGETKGTGFSDELKQSEQVIKHVDHCDHDDEKQICVEMPSSAPCHDDSGSPLVCRLGGKWYLLGTISEGAVENPENGLCSALDSIVLFAKVAHKAAWIRETINKHG